MKSLPTSKLSVLLFLLMTAGSCLHLQAQILLDTITLGDASISFSDFSKMGANYTTNIQGAFPASDGKSYSGWTKGSVKYYSSSIKSVIVFGTYEDGWLKSPTITSDYGFTVTVTYSSTSSSQLKIGSEQAITGQKATTVSTDGKGLTMSASTSSTSTTFTITNLGSSLLYVSKITITPNKSSTGGSGETKKEPGISFAQESYTATLGKAFVSPVLSNPNNLGNITYSSSNVNVATVDDYGTVSLAAAGTTTITATFTEDDTYAAGSASYTLTVQQASTPTATTFYKCIQTTDELVDGNVCLLYYSKMMASSFNTEQKFLNCASVTLENNQYTGAVNAANCPYEITITKEEGSGKYALYTSELYLTPISGKTTFGTSNSPAYSWNISFNNYGRVEITNSDETDRYIFYNSSYFKNYKTGTLPWLYQKQTTLQLKDAAQGWTTYYNKGFAYEMPQGVKGYYVSLDKNKKDLRLSLAYDEGAPVPANTPLLLYGKVGMYYPVVVNKAISPVPGTNYMQGERDGADMTSAGEDVIYYKLALDNNGEYIGFYYGAEDGGAFVMQNETTAYLALPKDEAKQVRSLILDAEAINRISPILTQQDPTAIYDLSGRRIYSPQRGLYIQGGRVVFLKGDSLH